MEIRAKRKAHPELWEKYRLALGEKIKEENIRNRTEILQLLGSHCIRCGFSDSRALQIDHVNGKGCKERRKFHNSSLLYYRFVLRRIKEGSKDYQLLCANCNTIKKVEKEELPFLQDHSKPRHPS